jgi:putative phosphoesterase
MRIAVVSDIHGNRRAFDAVLQDLRQVSPDLVLHGGDLAANGARPADIIDQIRALGWPGVHGNTDEMLWAPESLSQLAARHPKLTPILSAFQEMVPVTLEKIGEERLRWLATLPFRQSVEDVTVLHAGPDDLWRAPLDKASDAELQTTYASLGSPIVVYGHIHRPYVRRLESSTVANTGSLSLSYDGDPRASYLVVDGQDISIRRVEYERESEANELAFRPILCPLRDQILPSLQKS